MKKIDEQLQWYELNAARKDDEIIKANLRLIGSLYGEIGGSQDRIFIDKIIGTFCEIMEIQRDIINELMTQAEQGVFCTAHTQHNYAAGDTFPTEFTDDRQIQESFTSYCLREGRSSYTANDYCSRIRNLWRSFYMDYKNGVLAVELYVDESATLESPLINAYKYIDELGCYVGMMSAISQEKRNWANMQAALNKFVEFKVNNIKEN